MKSYVAVFIYKLFFQTFFGSRIISKNFWPPRSPDLTPPDFYLWGAMKNKIYCRNPRTINELKETVTDLYHNS